MQFAIWNNGSPRVLRSHHNVELRPGLVVGEVVEPLPEFNLYRYVELTGSPQPWQRVADAVAYSLKGDTITAERGVVDRPREEVLGEKLVALAAYRYAVETGGLTLEDGTQIRTDREDCAIIAGKQVYLDKRVQAQSVKWKGVDGFVEIPRAQFQEIAIRVAEHVQHCFDVEAGHALAIDALTTATAIAAYDFTAGW